MPSQSSCGVTRGVVLELLTEGRMVHIVAGGSNAGVRLREAVPQDMWRCRGPRREADATTDLTSAVSVKDGTNHTSGPEDASTCAPSGRCRSQAASASPAAGRRIR